MHKIYENDDIAMYFKKRYCSYCGNRLDRKRTERVVTKDDPDHKTYCSIGVSYKPHKDILVIGRSYCCSICQRTFTCDEQRDVIHAQKALGKKIVSEQEIAFDVVALGIMPLFGIDMQPIEIGGDGEKYQYQSPMRNPMPKHPALP